MRLTIFTRNTWLKIWLVVFCLITFFVNRGALPTDIMESRNIVTAREMVSDGNWLVPTMNGELRLEKPPLPTWVAGAIEEVCPDSLAAQRTAAGVMGCVWTLYLFLLIRYVSRRNVLAAVSVVVFLTCYNLILMGRSATWDIYCHAFMMAAIYYLTRGLYDDKRQKDEAAVRHYALRTNCWLVLAGVFMGLSFLSKGPVSFYALLLPYLVTLLLLPRPSMKGKWSGFALMIIVMVVLGSWWYIYLLEAHPVEVSAVIHKESGAWSNHNVRPWYYYWRFFLEMGAWSLIMLAALAVPYWRRHITLKRDYLIAVTWAIVSLVLLSLMPEKKTRYLLPSLAPCSVVVGCMIVNFCQGRSMDKVSRWLYRINGWLLTVVVLALPVAFYFVGVKKGTIDMGEEVLLSVFMVLLAVWLAICTIGYKPLRFLEGIATLFAFAEMFLLPTIGGSFGNPDGKSISAVRTDKRVERLPFYHSKSEDVRIELVYEAHRKILPLNLSDPMAVKKALPCAIVSQKWAREEIPANVLATVDTVSIGTFDDNKHPKGNKHYTSDFINHVTILKAKK